MPLAIRKGGLCAFCTFRASQSLLSPFQRHHGVRYSTEAGFQIRKIRGISPGEEPRQPLVKTRDAHHITRDGKYRPSLEPNDNTPIASRSDLVRPQSMSPREYAQYRHLRPEAARGKRFESKRFEGKRLEGKRSEVNLVRRPSMINRSREDSETKEGGIKVGFFEKMTGFKHLQLDSTGDNSTRPKSKVERAGGQSETTYGVFGRLLLEQVQGLQFSLLYKEQAAVKAWGIKSGAELEEKLGFFRSQLRACTKLAEEGKVQKEDNPLFFRMRNAFIKGNMAALVSEMKFAFINEVVEANFEDHHRTNQEKLADLRYPLEWFPATRALQRTVHLHIGPTNSGKTYQALQKLEAAPSGIYAGPLRLLAHEVYTRLNAKGKACALITGEERRIPENYTAQMSSCTVEMVPLNAKVDVAVIDEIQMMGDTERGWAWTQAFLGVQAKEVHLCGEIRTKEIVTDLCAAMGDKLVVHEYERLSPLSTQKHSLNGDLRNLEKGDAIILFSRVAIHAMKSDVERITGRRCAVVYGSLPPETRAQQAALFNDPNNDYDFLVASDAVGMGLNLSIKRVIFESTSKHDGTGFRLIAPSEIKQIAGRAGRYKTARDAIHKGDDAVVDPLGVDVVMKPSTSVGLVTTFERFDLPIVKRAMETDVQPLKSVGIFPPSDILLRFANYFPPNTPFSYIVLRLHDISSLNSQFHLCSLKDQVKIADLVQEFDLSNMDRITLMSAPISLRDAGTASVVKELAQCIAEQKNGALLDLKCLDIELLDKDIHDHPEGSKGYLRAAEVFHRAITLYLWLSYRFAGVFISQALAFHVKSLIEAKIDECLSEVQWNEQKRRQLNYLKQKAIKEQAAEDAAVKTAERRQEDFLENEARLVEEGSAVSSETFDGRDAEMEEEDDDLLSEETFDDQETQLVEEQEYEGDGFYIDETLEEQATERVEMDEAARDSEDSPAADGNIPVTPEQQLEELSETARENSSAPQENILETFEDERFEDVKATLKEYRADVLESEDNPTSTLIPLDAGIKAGSSESEVGASASGKISTSDVTPEDNADKAESQASSSRV